MKFSNMLIGVLVFLFFMMLSIAVRAETIVIKPAPQSCVERCTHGPAGTICIKDCY